MTSRTTTPSPYLEKAARLHERLISFDGHLDIPLEFGTPGFEADRDGAGKFDIPKIRRGKLSGAAATIHAAVLRPTAKGHAAGRAEHERRFAALTQMARDFPQDVGIAASPRQFRELVAQKKFAIVLAFQNAAPLDNGLGDLDAWAARGISIFAFTFIGNNAWADSARPYPYVNGGLHWNGLSPLGKQAVSRLNDLGVLIDVSQLSSAAFNDVIAQSRVPVLASHSGVRTQVDVDRNFSDTELKNLQRNGGLIQIVGFAPYLKHLDDRMIADLRSTWRRFGLNAPDNPSDMLSVNDPATVEWPEDRFWDFLHEFHVVLDLERPIASTSHLVDAIDHAVGLIGIDHVGIASDFNHAGGLSDWMDVSESMNVTAELLTRGYEEEAIAKLWGENFLRIWQVALDERAKPAIFSPDSRTGSTLDAEPGRASPTPAPQSRNR